MAQCWIMDKLTAHDKNLEAGEAFRSHRLLLEVCHPLLPLQFTCGISQEREGLSQRVDDIGVALRESLTVRV